MGMAIFRRGLLHFAGLVVEVVSVGFGQNARDLVKGNLIQFNDNGAWCWYQDERAVIDTVSGKLVVGSVASASGVGGSPRSGDVEAVLFDLETRRQQRVTLREGDPGVFYCDDHNAPGFLVRPDSKYLAMYAAHFGDTSSHYRVYNAGAWGAEHVFNWKQQRPGGVNFQTTYSNLYYLSTENRVYNFVRGNNKSPNLMISTDMGDTWSYGGQLTRNAGVGYNDGYYKYWGNGVDRIDFVFTEYHPRDFYTSIYHGFIQGGKSYSSPGAVADDNILDTLDVPTPQNFTKVFADSTMLAGYLMRRCWNTDLVRYPDGTIVTIVTARTSQFTGSDVSINPNHAFIYCRYDGSRWTYGYLGNAGPKLYSSEADYTGNAAIHPNDPNTIYISTTYDPRDSTVNLGVYEIFKGVTTDQGASWAWSPITQKSVRSNIRPIVPAWDKNNTALLWWRGTYASAQSYNAAIVGILDRRLESISTMTYVDATPGNTSFATGAPLVATGPDTAAGPADNQWHWRTGYGNGGSVLASAEVGGENAPSLRTQCAAPGAGTFDLWVNFWANPTADWRIKAGLSLSGMQVLRSMACKQVEAGDHESTLILTGSGNTALYQAYLGRVQAGAGDTLKVFVDDEAIQTGTTGTLIGNSARTWYDGLSYAKVNAGTVNVAEHETPPAEFSLGQNYPNPFNPSTTIPYSLSHSAFVSLKIYTLLGQEVVTLVDQQMIAGTHSVRWNARGVPSGVYYYRVTAGKHSQVNKMILVR